MTKRTVLLFLVMVCGLMAGAQELIPKKDLLIRHSSKIKPGIYLLPANDSSGKPVIIIEGNNIVVDFKQAVLTGNKTGARPDEFEGTAILVRNAKNVTIRNLNVHGYKIGLRAENVDGLKIEHCDLSYNYRQHLNSTQEKEDISDWMSYHHNENNEWLRYGAAIYLNACTNFLISYCRVTGGQNALMMMQCTRGKIWNNDFSFNSGIGIGMYRSSDNQVMYNRIDFNVRGYSHGIYNRGQDSAGILVYEQSNNNLFFNNSVTHGGDGFFLWAGQTTMDTGKGGCNGNLLLNNDFSYAPTNGVEATFSSNKVIGNRIFECDHGIWGGYSYQTEIMRNQFRNNRIAIAIEHGQHNRIENNIFYRDGEAIRLWSRGEQPADWGYARYHDTRSADYRLALNSFNSNPVVYNITRTDSLRIFTNRYSNCEQIYRIDSTVTHIDTADESLMDSSLVMPRVKGAMDPFRGNAKWAGRKNILVTEWGPYDFRYPIIWNTNPADTGSQMNFDLLGPRGKWKIISVKGLEGLTLTQDSFPAHLSAQRSVASRTDIEVVAAYQGPVFKDAFGQNAGGSKPSLFRFTKFFQPIAFTVSFYDFDSLSNPIHSNYSEWIRTHSPFLTENRDRLDYAWWGGIKAGEKQHPQFLTIAEGQADFLPGDYEMGVTWDDAVRVYVDGKLVLDEWEPSRYQFDESPHRKIRLSLGGRQAIRVEHVELGGFATLSLKLEKRRSNDEENGAK